MHKRTYPATFGPSYLQPLGTKQIQQLKERPSFSRTLSSLSEIPTNIVDGASMGASLLPPQPDDYMAIPPNTLLTYYNFAHKKPHRYTRAGRLSHKDAQQNQRINWDAVQPRTAPDGKRIYLFSDAHCHMHNYTGAGHKIADVVKAAIELGVRHFTMIPIPTTLVSVYDDQKSYTVYGNASHCGPSYYVPTEMAHERNLSEKMLKKIQKQIELRVDPSVDTGLVRQVVDALKYGEIEPRHLEMMDLSLTGIHLGSRRVCKDILKALHDVKEQNDNISRLMHAWGKSMEGQRVRFNQIGEVTVSKEIVETVFAGKSQANLRSNIASTRDAMRLAGIIGMPFILHCDVDKPDSLKERHDRNRKPMNIEEIKSLMRSCPNTDIIWAHAGGLGRFVKESPRHLEELEKLMQDPSLSHVQLDISWSVVADQIMRDDAARDAWARFLVRHQDRILFGSDALTPQTNAKWTETFDVYAGVYANGRQGLLQKMDELDPTGNATQKILFGNYRRTIVGARERVDCFTDYVLPEIIESVQSISGPENIDLEALWAERDKIYRTWLESDIFEEDEYPIPDSKIEPLLRIERTLNHFKKRDVLINRQKAFPNVAPDKAREHQMMKGVINRMTFGKTMKNYKPGSHRSGDFISNRIRRTEARNFQRYMTEVERELRTLPAGVNQPANEYARLYQKLQRALAHVDSNLPPDEILRALRIELTAFRNKLVTNHGIMLPPLPQPAG